MNGLYKMKQMMFGLIFCSIAFDTDAIIPHECNGKVSNASVLPALEQGVLHAYDREPIARLQCSEVQSIFSLGISPQ